MWPDTGVAATKPAGSVRWSPALGPATPFRRVRLLHNAADLSVDKSVRDCPCRGRARFRASPGQPRTDWRSSAEIFAPEGFRASRAPCPWPGERGSRSLVGPKTRGPKARLGHLGGETARECRAVLQESDARDINSDQNGDLLQRSLGSYARSRGAPPLTIPSSRRCGTSGSARRRSGPAGLRRPYSSRSARPKWRRIGSRK